MKHASRNNEKVEIHRKPYLDQIEEMKFGRKKLEFLLVFRFQILLQDYSSIVATIICLFSDKFEKKKFLKKK